VILCREKKQSFQIKGNRLENYLELIFGDPTILTILLWLPKALL
jgi:hypothetical protein